MSTRLNRQVRRYKVFCHYGGTPPTCECCGEPALEFLSIDHIEGNGSKHRREMGRNITIYDWLARNEFPSGFRILCQNCNSSYGHYGYCPHKVGEILKPEIINYIDNPPGKGERHGGAVLSDIQVRDIKRRYIKNKESGPVLAKEFGVSKHTVYNISYGRSWRSLKENEDD